MSTESLSKFIPLHLHTEFSLLDGASRLDDICAKAKAAAMPALAITDHGTMYGAYQFYHEAKSQGLKPIIGCEIYVINGDHKQKGKDHKQKLYHLVLLAKNDIGYKNLIKIVSEACIEGFYYKPRISKTYLQEHSGGLIALSACLGGEVNNLLLNGQDKAAQEAASSYQEIFGEDFYLEVQDHFYPEDRLVNPKIFQLARALGLKVVASNDSHYTDPEDAKAHDALLCLQIQSNISDFPRMHFSGHEHMKTEAEMLSLFRDHLSAEQIQEAVQSSPQEIYQKIEDYQIFSKPAFHVPDPKVPEGHSFESYLKEISYEGLIKRYGKLEDLEPDLSKQVRERLELELAVMNDSGFASYFIVVWDFIKWAREHSIPVGPGRGSAAGSLVAYALGITNIDPLKYDLLFERFLNPERKSMPDIDTDFCIERREEVINYVREKYGAENVSQIITFNRLTSRAVIKDMARVLEYPYAKAEELAKMIPVVRGKPRSIEWMKENHQEFAAAYRNDPAAREVIDLALRNEGINKSFGVHAAGVIISDIALTEIVPISRNNEGAIITQFAMEECAKMGLLKMDFLGLRNLTMIQKAINIIEAHSGQKIDIDSIPLDDQASFDMISSGNLAGIFQLETSSGMRQIARDLAPQSLEDISALIALYRPGPLDTGMIDDFIACKSGKQRINYAHPLLEPILKNTYGTIVYQEQIMKIAQVLGGFTLGEADSLRRAMGKKKPEELLPYESKFLEGCSANAIPESLAKKLFEQMLSFAEYCFNKSHSTAYGMITYQTAYLKTHYPVEYMTSLFQSCSGDTDRIKIYIIEAERMGIRIAAPNVNRSEIDFAADVNSKTITFGLSAIKGVGTVATQEIIRERDSNGAYKDFFDFIRRVNHKIVNKKTTEALIRSGAFDNLGAGRKAMVENLEAFVEAAKRKQEEASKGQSSLFDLASESVELRPIYKSGLEDEYPERDLQTMEYELLGLFVNNHPMHAVQELSSVFAKHHIVDFAEDRFKDSSKVSFTALITSFEKKITKAKKIIAILNLEDLEARIEGVLFSKKLDAYGHLLEKGKRVLIEGTLSKHSEGDMSVLIDNLKDIDDMGILEFDIRVDLQADMFMFLHSIKSFISKAENKGSFVVVLRFLDQDQSTRVSLGPNYAISQHAAKALKDLISAGISQPNILNTENPQRLEPQLSI